MPGLYLHIPFCEHKCLYCDFYSVVPARGEEDATERFVRALETELSLRARDDRFRVVFDTVFFGGGTPSLLQPDQLERILDVLHANYSIHAGAEITLEANPGTVDRARLRAYRASGINRLSLGVQSFRDDDLRFLTRIHSARQALDAVRDARAAGFENLSLDLIFGLPSQSPDAWLENLRTAAECKPQHLSCYSLIIEPGTPLHRLVATRQVTPVDPEADAELYEHTMAFLTSKGFLQYEVSNFCRPGFASRHNSLYWNHEHYLGFGPSAHSFWGGLRWWNAAQIDSYGDRLREGILPVEGEERLSRRELMTEEVFLGLRSRGIDVAGFRKRYAVDLMEDRRDEVSVFLRRRLLYRDGDLLRCTPRGYVLCDAMSVALLPREVS